MKLHHIGIVVKNIQESAGELTKFLDFESIAVPTLVGSQKVNICFLKTNNVFLELIEPAQENSPISDFVEKGGGTLQKRHGGSTILIRFLPWK